MLDDTLNLFRSQFKNGSDGLKHVVFTADICAEHVVEDDILEILLTGALHGGHPLQSSDVVLQLLNPVLKCQMSNVTMKIDEVTHLVFFLFHRNIELKFPQTCLSLVLLVPQLLDLHIFP